MDPMAAVKDMTKTWGHAYAGHFDSTGHVEGEIALRGVTTPIDCVSTMDHSWGVRAERQTSRLSWMHAHFSRDLAVHVIADFPTHGGPDAPTELQITHGYVLDHGEVRGIKAGKGTTSRSGFYPSAIEIEVTDAGDRTWHLEGTALTTFPWQAWPGTVGHNSLLRWSHEGSTGFGECMDFIGLGELGAVYDRA
jgi:hypothetical protein